MATKEKVDAQKEIASYIDSMQPFAQAICKKLRAIILKADPSIKEEWKWGPHYSSNGMVCGYGGFQKHVKLTFFKGASLKDPSGLFNSSLEGNVRRAIDVREGETLDEEAFKALIREAVDLNRS